MFDFLKIGDSVKSLAKELRDLREKIEQTKRKIEDVMYASAHPDDILAAAKEYLENKEAEYKKLFRERVFSSFSSSPMDESQRRNGRAFINLSFGGEDIAFIGMFGAEKLLDLFKSEIANMSSDQYGMRAQERGPELSRLKKELQILVAKEEKLVTDAQAIGITVQ